MRRLARIFASSLVLSFAVALPATAQDPPATPSPPPAAPSWTGTLSAGIALTAGNTDTTTTNLAFDVQSDRTKRNVVKAEGLNIRSSQDGGEIVDRTSLSMRDEFAFSGRGYVFGQVQYLQDAFKSIDYLLSPTGGVGFKLLDSELTTLAADLSVGGVVEKNPDLERRSDGAVTFAEKGSRKLGNATITQSLNALWIVSDFGDALYTFQVGLAADVLNHLQLKVDFLDTYKTTPPSELVQRNDTAFITSFAFKF
jgi:putative salt-induced outer membrane protein YdiY